MRELGIRATILRLDTGAKPLLSKAFGSSMAGVPARRDMHFRIGSMAIPHLITLLLQLEDEGRLSLDDKLSRFLPEMPDADRITLRMLADNTSGYRDWIQGNQTFVDLLLANVFKQWTVGELLAHAFARGPACDPGTCFNYAHTNYAVLSEVITHVTGRHRPVDRQPHARTDLQAPRAEPDRDLEEAGDARPGPPRLCQRSGALRGLHLLEPFLDDRGGDRDERDDRRRRPHRPRRRHRRADLPPGKSRALRPHHGRYEESSLRHAFDRSDREGNPFAGRVGAFVETVQRHHRRPGTSWRQPQQRRRRADDGGSGSVHQTAHTHPSAAVLQGMGVVVQPAAQTL